MRIIQLMSLDNVHEPASLNASTAIQIKGSRQGLLLVIREDAEVSLVMQLVEQRFQSDSSFLANASLFVDLGWREADGRFFEALEQVFTANSVVLAGVLSTSNSAREVAAARGHKTIIGRLGLAKHQGRRLKAQPPAPPQEAAPLELPAVDTRAAAMAPFFDNNLVLAPPVPAGGLPDALFAPSLDEMTPASLAMVMAAPTEPPSEDRESEATLYIRRTLRSGTKAMYPGNIVVMGDVNPGAELEAEGDVIVIGILRGKAHAGSAGNPNAQVWSLSLQPIQLRIADFVWVAGEEKPKGRNGHRAPGPHKAIVKDGQVHIVSAL